MALVDALREINATINQLNHEPVPLPSRVFVSYASPDRAAVERHFRDLQRAGFDPWFDRSLAGGDVFRDRITEELDRAGRVVAVWTRASIQSTWVRWEAARAMAQGKLVSLHEAGLALGDIPAPFTEENVLPADDLDGLLSALRGA